MKITKVKAFQIYDSRGLPTIACEITIDDHFKGLSKIPSGASTGKNEACELRDNDKTKWFGKGVQNAIKNINTVIADKIIDFEAFKQRELDSLLVSLDGTSGKKKLGANAILAVSLAYCIACSKAKDKELFKYISSDILNKDNTSVIFPIPFINVINGGKHANNNLDFQEFMIVPLNQSSFHETMRIASECFVSIQNLLLAKNYSIAKGDEGGFSVDFDSPYQVLDFLSAAIESAGYKLGEDVCFALDVAASEFYKNGFYQLTIDGKKEKYSADKLMDLYIDLCAQYPIISIEDPFEQNDFLSFAKLKSKLKNVQIVGDDLYCTNSKLLNTGIKSNATTAILIKPNQIGTLSECIDTIQKAQSSGMRTMISHRSGDTEDDFISDLCLATNSPQIKTGSMSRSERLSKYNRLLYVYEMLINK